MKFLSRFGPLFVPLIALAQTSSTVPHVSITSVSGLVSILCNVFGWMFYVLILLSIIMILVAGFNYVTAGDNAEKVSKANKIIVYAAIAVAVALLARAIPVIVGSFLGATGSVAAC